MIIISNTALSITNLGNNFEVDRENFDGKIMVIGTYFNHNRNHFSFLIETKVVQEAEAASYRKITIFHIRNT